MVKVLIVEDNKDIRYTIRSVLSELDSSYEFAEAESGEKCLQKIEKETFDVVLLDIMMPGIDGLETALRIRENPKHAKMKIVYLTAKTDPMTKGVGTVSGEDFVEKPFEPEDLDKRIKAALKK